MSATSTPYGLEPTVLAGGSPSGVIRSILLTANVATGFFNGDVVNVGAGVATPVTATPSTTRNASTPTGIFVGCTYFDTNKQFITANFFPANGFTSFNANGPINLMIMDHPDVQFKVQANGSVAYTAIGKNASLTNFSNGSTVTGNSRVQLDAASIATTNTLGVRIIDIAPVLGNAAGDAFTDVICMWNQNVHAYRNILGV
jgi:hypothetical protein